ncbi:MAG: lamin tail domain-containing protein, partial [Pseudomonadota bacterium]|nr:lamin tail domain-containing protein [Pseudomonadota bacterium]
MHSFARRLALTLVLFGSAFAAQAQVVISQVYGGGGNAGSTYKNDFIELRNNGTAAVSVNGWSVQYASSTGSSWQRTNLVGSIPAGGYYLIKQMAGAGGTVDLPPADATGVIPMAATAGKVALVGTTTTLIGVCPKAEAVDFVGFGSSANCFEGGGPTPTLSNSTAALRAGDGATDSNNNNADFSAGAPNPRNSSNVPPPPPPPALALSIAQIQGDGLQSAYVDKNVVSEGIVTARKFNNGFFLQSANDDGNAATSDGIFVFTGSAPPASATVGNRVRVTGKVTEFTPSSNPNQLSITQIVSPAIEVLASGVALPAAVELSSADLGAAATPGTL